MEFICKINLINNFPYCCEKLLISLRDYNSRICDFRTFLQIFVLEVVFNKFPLQNFVGIDLLKTKIDFS